MTSEARIQSSTGSSIRLAVIGWPVAHSLSPAIHGYWIEEHGLDAGYEAVAVKPEELAAFVKAAAEAGFRGFNVTIPHKEAIVGLLDGIDDDARAIGAVNTVVVSEDGGLLGHNTDAAGFLDSLTAADEGWPGWQPGTGPVLVLGAGGAARAVLQALVAAGVGDIRLSNRNAARAEALLAEMWAPGQSRLSAVPWEARGEAAREAALLVNATSLGLDTTEMPLNEAALQELVPDTLIYDLVYDAQAAGGDTAFVQGARRHGLRARAGLGMLCHQAARAFELWFGFRPAVNAGLMAALAAELKARSVHEAGGESRCTSSA